MEILTERQIIQKIERIAIEILERNFNEQKIILAGINNNGHGFAKMLQAKMDTVAHHIETTLTRISINPANPLSEEIRIDIPATALQGCTIIVVDDVANTGRTAFFAIKPLLDFLPKKVEVAVLVDREHKSFPISSNYVGLSLATTLNDHIDVKIINTDKMTVHLN